MSMKKFYLRKFRSAKAENRFTNSMERYFAKLKRKNRARRKIRNRK